MLKCACGGTVVECEGEAACGRCGIVYGPIPDAGPAWSEPVRANRFGGQWRLYRVDRMVSHPDAKTEMLIESICRKCSVPDAVKKRAVSLHADVVAHDLHRGWNREARVAAVVTLACRLEGVPRTTKAVCDAAGVKAGQAHHIYCMVVSRLNIRVPPPDPAAYVGAIAAACGVPEAVRRLAVGMLQKHGAALSGKDPTTLAAAALYAACSDSGCGVSQQALADAARVSAVSMRLRRQDLRRCAKSSQVRRACPSRP